MNTYFTILEKNLIASIDKKEQIITELKQHISEHEQALVQQGVSVEVAHQQAMEALGDPLTMAQNFNISTTSWMKRDSTTFLFVVAVQIAAVLALWASITFIGTFIHSINYSLLKIAVNSALALSNVFSFGLPFTIGLLFASRLTSKITLIRRSLVAMVAIIFTPLIISMVTLHQQIPYAVSHADPGYYILELLANIDLHNLLQIVALMLGILVGEKYKGARISLLTTKKA